MKTIKLLTPIFTLATTTSVVLPLVACNKDPVDPTGTVDVTIDDSVVEHVTLEKTKAEKGKRFETKVSFDSAFYMNKVTVKVGEKTLNEGDIEISDEFDFFYDYINNDLIIKEGIINAKVVLTFEFTYVYSDTVSYVLTGHEPYLVSNHEIYIQDTSRIYTFYLYLDFTGWPEFYSNKFPQYFCFSMNSDIKYNAKFTSAPTILTILEDPINVTLIDVDKDNPDKCFKLDGDGYGYDKKDNLKLFMSMQCTFDSVNHFRFYGLNK